jgi:hypothetical protein
VSLVLKGKRAGTQQAAQENPGYMYRIETWSHTLGRPRRFESQRYVHSNLSYQDLKATLKSDEEAFAISAVNCGCAQHAELFASSPSQKKGDAA